MTVPYLEDFVAGQRFSSGRMVVEREHIERFASKFDPQPFHLDEKAAQDTIFRGLAASGWHTAEITMRLLIDSDMRPAGGIVGAGFDEFRWLRPVRPGDELRLESDGRLQIDDGENDVERVDQLGNGSSRRNR